MNQYGSLGKNRTNLGELEKGRRVNLIVSDNGYHGTLGTRITRIDQNGQEWIKLNGKYWKYPEQIER